MEDEQKEKEKALIKWTVEDFQKELPGVQLSFVCIHTGIQAKLARDL